MSGGTFVPHQLFASGAQGAWYDPSDYSTLFQNAAGTTAVTAVEQPVRLMLDRSGRGNNATAPNDASRPILRARYNLLTFSEQFNDAVWTKGDGATVTANATTAPDGTLTADQIDFAASELSRIQQPILTAITETYTLSVWLRVASGSETIRFGHATNLSSITVTNTWQRFTANQLINAGDSANLTLRNSAAGGAKTVFAWGASLLTAADQAATGGAYQRVAAATDYDTSNPVWRPYLAFDGSDDSLSTSSIDFSGTDEMTVFAGVTKLSDAALSVLAELTAGYSANPNSFVILAPLTTGISGNYFNASRGTAAENGNQYATSAVTPAPVTNVLTTTNDISGDLSTIRLNGLASGTNATGDQGSGNFANAPLFIGRRNNAELPFNGRLYGLTVLGRTATAPELSAMEAWVAGKTGVNLP